MGNTTNTANHPCYDEAASKQFARMHLPVAPRCNIACNYCNRKYDCSNECRPGVTSKVLTPEEALQAVINAKSKMPNLTTIGIAGPGDSLANPIKTFKTLELINQTFNGMNLCISTNGLMLPDYIDELMDANAKFITVTVNALDAFTASKVYRSVRFKDKTYRGIEATEILTQRQQEGIIKLQERGATVKINTVYMPDINVNQIPKIADFASEHNVTLFNLTPLIPVEGTPLANHRSPSELELSSAKAVAGKKMDLMDHCHQCRSDACGTLDDQETSTMDMYEGTPTIEHKHHEMYKSTTGAKCG